jgi:hypothetical protein
MQTRSRSDQQCSLIDIQEENKKQFLVQQQTLHRLFGSKMTGKRSRSKSKQNKTVENHFKNVYFVKELITIICDYLEPLDKKPLLQKYKTPLSNVTIIGDIEDGKLYIELMYDDTQAILTLDEDKSTCTINNNLNMSASSYHVIRYHNQTYTYLQLPDNTNHRFDTVHAYSPLSLNEYSIKHYYDQYLDEVQYSEIFKNNILITNIDRSSLLDVNCINQSEIGILKDGTEFWYDVLIWADSPLEFILFLENKINVNRPFLQTRSLNPPWEIRTIYRARIVSILNSNYVFFHVISLTNKTKCWFVNIITKEWIFIMNNVPITYHKLSYSHHHKKIFINTGTRVLWTINVPLAFFYDQN